MKPRRRRHRHRRRHPARRRRAQRCTSAGAPAPRGSRTARAPAASSSPPSTCRSRRCAARTASPSSRWSPRTRRSSEAGWDGELPYDSKRVGCIIGTGIGGIGTLEPSNHQVMLRGGREEGLAALDPADDGQRRRRGAVRMRHGLRGPSFAPLSACAAGSHAIGAVGRADPLRPRRTPSSPAAPRPRSTPLAQAAFGALDAMSRRRHLAPVRRPPRRLRHGRGRRRARARGRATRRASAGPTSSATCAATAPRPTPTT